MTSASTLDRATPESKVTKYRCPDCGKSQWLIYSTLWSCQNCGQQHPCTHGIPRLYLEGEIGDKDRKLRDRFYNGFLGNHYQYVMPFLSLPARPAWPNWKGWLVYAAIVLSLCAILGSTVLRLATRQLHEVGVADIVVVLLILALGAFLSKHLYLLNLLLLAVPAKLSMLLHSFHPVESFTDVHCRVLQQLLARKDRLQVLDISTGTCNSLYRHGWMQLSADYTGLDLSEAMLLQGQKFMARKRVPMDFVLGDASCLPFECESFDVVLNYGAMNGYTNPAVALQEMARVTKSGGLVLFLDEQLYDKATFFEKLYFRHVLSSHNVIDRCPVEMMPETLLNIRVHQVYRFYYICTCYKGQGPQN